MKKIALLVIALSLVLVGVLTLASCNTECEHQYEETITKAATCKEAGVKTLTCALCGDVKTEEIAKTADHKWKSTANIDVAATCQAPGQKSVHCSVCGVSKADSVEVLAQLDHDLPAAFTTVTEANCTEDGLKTKTCSICEKVIESEVIPAGHNWAEDVTPDAGAAATCTTAGTASIYCITCGEKKEDSTVDVPALGHDMSVWILDTAATATEAGKKYRACKNDGCPLRVEETIPAGTALTSVFEYRDEADWTAQAAIKGNISPDVSVEKDGENAYLKFFADAANGSCGKSGNFGFVTDLSGAIKGSDTDLVVAFSLYTVSGQPNYTLRLMKGNDIQCLIGVENEDKYGKGNLAEWGNDKPIATPDLFAGKWIDVVIVVHAGTKKMDYYVNGNATPVLTDIGGSKLPTDLSEIDGFRVQESFSYKSTDYDGANQEFRVDNLALYQGTVTANSLKAIFAVTNNSGLYIAD